MVQDGTTALGTVALDGNGRAQLTGVYLSTGTHTLTASYAGDANFTAAQSAPATVNVSRLLTSTQIAASAPEVSFGEAVQLTARVYATGSAAPGMVTFADVNGPVGVAPLDANGMATLIISGASAGTHGYTAEYAGKGGYQPSQSTQVVVAVDPAPVTVTLASSESTGSYGDSITLTAQVSSAAGTPAGAVNFMHDGVLVGTVATDAGGQAVLTTTKLPGGADHVVAAFAGADNFAPAESQSVTVTLSPVADFSVVLKDATLTIKAGQSGTLPLGFTGSQGFDQNITMSCSGLAQGMGCSFTPAAVSLSNGEASSTLTVTTTGSTGAATAMPALPSGTNWPWGAALASVLGLGLLLGERKLCRLAGLALLGAALAGCGGSPNSSSTTASNSATPPGTYTITVNATADAATHSSQVKVVVQ
jgi:hypothetical protein